jgi:TRAP-type C4-dicarboxylate transport system substrate-binding protein
LTARPLRDALPDLAVARMFKCTMGLRGQHLGPVGAALLLCLLSSPVAGGEPVVLRFATDAPDGSAWVREMRAFGREVQTATNDEVRLKLYVSGVAGDELQIAERIKRDQLDGIISAGMICARLSPSMRTLRIPALFRDRDEASFVMNRMKPFFDDEFVQAGFVNLIDYGFGFSVFFTRKPFRSLEELKKQRIWMWELDETLLRLFPDLFQRVLLPVANAASAYDAGTIDGFLSIPTGALAFQWSSRARYVADLHVAFLTGCMLLARRSFDGLSHEAQQALRTAAAKTQARAQDLNQRQDELLLGGLFAKQGLKTLPISDRLRSEFEAAVQKGELEAEQRIPSGTLFPMGAREFVRRQLAEYRRRKSETSSRR